MSKMTTGKEQLAAEERFKAMSLEAQTTLSKRYFELVKIYPELQVWWDMQLEWHGRLNLAIGTDYDCPHAATVVVAREREEEFKEQLDNCKAVNKRLRQALLRSSQDSP